MTYSTTALFQRVDTILSSAPRRQLQVLAQTLRVDRHTIEKGVLRSTGMTFRQYQNSKTIAWIRRLLAEGTCITQKEIAFSLGYAHCTSFSRFVKRHTGQSLTSLMETPANREKAPEMLSF